MKLGKIKTSFAVAVATLASYSPLLAQTICDNPANASCGGNDVPQLAAPAVLVLIAIGVIGAIAMAKRK